MEKITPAVRDFISSIDALGQSSTADTTTHVFSGECNGDVWVSIHGSTPMQIRNLRSVGAQITNHRSVSKLDDKHCVIATSYAGGTEANIADLVKTDGYTYIGKFRSTKTVFRNINLSDLLDGKVKRLDYSGIGVIFGATYRDAQYLDYTFTSDVMVDLGHSNLAGVVLIPVVEKNDLNNRYYVNIFNTTIELKSQPQCPLGIHAGLWMLREGVYTPLGAIDDFIYKSPADLSKDLILYSSKSEAERFRSNADYIATLSDNVKFEATAREIELSQVKSETTKLDNEVKVKTIEAKGEYEKRSVARKDTLEESSFGRNAMLASAAMITATLGFVTKMSSTFSTLTSASNPVVTGGVLLGALLAGICASETMANIFTTASSVLTNTITSITEGVVSVCRTAATVTSAIWNSGVSVVRGICTGFGLFS